LFLIGGRDSVVSGGYGQVEAAATIRECRRALALSGRTVIEELTGGVDLLDWQRCPEGEVYDPASHVQYFYHRHPTPAAPRDGLREHGHFHLFLRAEGMPAGVAPLVLPELAVADAPLRPQAAPAKRGGRDEVCHLVAIALDGCGDPVRLFTTNRWVTGESWHRADDVIAMLDRFNLARGGGSELVNHWLGAMVQLFRPEIAALLRERDAAVTARRQRRRGNVFEDPRLEILSSRDIDVDERLAAQPVPHPARHSRPRLPRMAEGWGV
jgi:hypothetical protein